MHIMTRKLSILLFLFISLTANATSQVGDILIWEKDTLTLFSNPLELRADKDELSKIIDSLLLAEERRLYPKKYEAEVVETMNSTACWRGYIAEWTIINDKLYLSNIYACHDNRVRVDLKKIFGKEIQDNLLFANWVTDKLVVPKGECIEYVHLDYKSIYETETIIETKDGKLVESRTYKNYIARKSKFTTDTAFTGQRTWAIHGPLPITDLLRRVLDQSSILMVNCLLPPFMPEYMFRLIVQPPGRK